MKGAYMDWYYADGQTPVGPLTESDFQRLVEEGRITAETLVWNEQMKDWQEYRELSTGGAGDTAASGGVTLDFGGIRCSECGNPFLEDEMIRYGNAYVCAACKPAFVQKLKEGVIPAGAMRYGGFWIRFVARLVDGLILVVVNVGLNIILFGTTGFMARPPQDLSSIMGRGLLSLFLFAVTIAYETWFVGRFGGTPGKMVCNLKIVRPDSSRLSYARAFGRHWATYLSSLILFIGYIMAGFDREKRALHDRICDTRVIKR
jgi:uncharacterized RDD family membrane protein YckC